MKKILLVIVILLFLFSLVAPMVVHSVHISKKEKVSQVLGGEQGDGSNFYNLCYLDDGLDQYQLFQNGMGLGVFNRHWSAQSFVPFYSNLSMVKLLLSQYGNPIDGITVKIRDSLDGPDITYAYKTSSSIQIGNTIDWVSFDFPDVNLIPDNTYYIILCSPESNDETSNVYVWWLNTNENSYSVGGGYGSDDNGITWFDGMGDDYGFKTYFCPPAEQLDQVNTNINFSIGMPVAGSQLLAQEFIPSVRTISKLELYLRPFFVESTPTIKIRKNLTGSDLTSCSSIPITLPPAECTNVLTFDFPDVNVTPGIIYYIVLSYPKGNRSTDDCWHWHIDARNDTYKKGQGYNSDDGGLSWYVWDLYEPGYDFWFKIYGYNGSPPYTPKIPSGPEEGKINSHYIYSSISSDPDGDRVKYCFDWGDGTYTWTCYYNSGEIASLSHVWNQEGAYELRIRVKDEHGAQSEWSDPLSVTMPKSKPYLNTLFLQFLQNHPLIYQLLQRFLKL